jgi:hypothetical protein
MFGFGFRKKEDLIKQIMYEAAEDMAGIIRPITIKKIYREKYEKDIDESEVMKLANKLIEKLEKHGTPPIIKYQSEEGTRYIHLDKFDDWLEKSKFYDELKTLFVTQIFKTKGLKTDIEKHKIEDLLAKHGIPRGLASEAVIKALCTKKYLIEVGENRYTMPDVREDRVRTLVMNKFRSMLEKKVFLPEDDLVEAVTQEVNKELIKADDTLKVDEGDVRGILEDMLGDRYVRVAKKVNDKTLNIIVDIRSLMKKIDESEPLIVERLKSLQMDKLGKDMLTKEDVAKVVEDIISEEGGT